MKASKLLALVLVLCMVLTVSAFASGGPGGASGAPGGGGSGEPDSYDAVLDITTDTEITGESMESVTGDESVIHVYDGAKATITDSDFVNGGSGSSGGDAASFYGVGATLLVSDGEMYVDDVTIDSTVGGGTGVFAYKDGVAYVRNADIHTTQGSAGGLHVAGGGTLYAWDCNVETEAGMAAAAIRSDRGGGLMVIDGGRYVTNGGTGAVYVTADISVHDAYLYTGGSEAIAIEGKNTIRLFDCELEGNMIPNQINDNNVWNIIVYQSMSGDADVGTSHFEMVGGTLTTHAGPILYNTNTSSYITLAGVDIVRGDDTTYFLQVTGNSSSRTWGRAGANGANCIFTAVDQTLPGDVVYDTISNLDLYLLEGSELTGAVNCDDSFNGGTTGDGIANVIIDKDSTWVVTGDSCINGTLSCEGAIENAKIVDASGKTLAGSGEFTVTVGAFEAKADVSGAGAVPVWEDYAVENPFAEEAPASGEPSGSPEAAAPAAGGVSEDAYKEYLHQWLIAEDEVNDTMTEEIRENEFMPLIWAGDYTTFPAEMLWNGMLENGCPMTFDEFVAAGGVY